MPNGEPSVTVMGADRAEVAPTSARWSDRIARTGRTDLGRERGSSICRIRPHHANRDAHAHHEPGSKYVRLAVFVALSRSADKVRRTACLISSTMKPCAGQVWCCIMSSPFVSPIRLAVASAFAQCREVEAKGRTISAVADRPTWSAASMFRVPFAELEAKVA